MKETTGKKKKKERERETIKAQAQVELTEAEKVVEDLSWKLEKEA